MASLASSNLTYEGVPYEVIQSQSGKGKQVSSGASVNEAALSVQDLINNKVKYVRIQWVDLINNIRFRVVPLPYFQKLLKTSRPGTSLTKASLGLVFIAIAEGFNATGEYLYAVDLSTLRICPYAPGHASVMGWFEEKEPITSLVGIGHRSIEVDLCPRTILRRVVENAKQISNVDFLVGFETEFILLKNTSPIQAANSYGWCNAPALSSGTPESRILEEIAEALEASGVELQMYHAEAAPGQYEVVTGPLPPLQAVDALIHTRETIFNIASKHGLRATLAPRVFLDDCGSAAHAHISIHSSTNSPSHQHPNLTALESSFLAGILTHLASFTLLLLPTTASYKRMMDGVWSGGTYVCWGTDNREAPIRLCNASSPSSRNFELKTLDGTANPYLAMAAVLGAGLEGVLEGKELTLQDCKGEKSAALLGEQGRKELGISERLPLSWEEARAKFEKSDLVEAVFGKEFREKYLNVNKVLKEQLTFGLMDDEELKLLVETY